MVLKVGLQKIFHNCFVVFCWGANNSFQVFCNLLTTFTLLFTCPERKNELWFSWYIRVSYIINSQTNKKRLILGKHVLLKVIEHTEVVVAYKLTILWISGKHCVNTLWKQGTGTHQPDPDSNDVTSRCILEACKVWFSLKFIEKNTSDYKVTLNLSW